MKSRTLFFVAVLAMLAVLLSACAPAATPAPTFVMGSSTEVPATATVAPTTVAKPKNPQLILATTTSVQDSGLLDTLIPLFEKQMGYQIKVVAVGSGQAIQMGQQGNADVLVVHSPTDEKNFMAQQYGKDRMLIMHNYFIVVGPASDPAHIKGDASVVDAFKKIAAAKAPFISRGDKSGTNSKELAIWKAAGIDPAGTKAAWYVQTGQGMGATLTVASEKEGYTLTDRATYLANKANLKLDVLIEQDTSLMNVYHVITVNPGRWPKVNYEGALAFAKWLLSADTQSVIGQFGVDKYGQQLFIPDAGKTDAQLGLP